MANQDKVEGVRGVVAVGCVVGEVAVGCDGGDAGGEGVMGVMGVEGVMGVVGDEGVVGDGGVMGVEGVCGVGGFAMTEKSEITMTADELQQSALEDIEDTLFRDSTEVLAGALRFADLREDEVAADAPPAHWVDQLGLEAAERRFRAAKYAMMPAKDAPVGLTLAKAIHGNITKARAARSAVPRTMNFAILVQGPPPQLEERTVDDE